MITLLYHKSIKKQRNAPTHSNLDWGELSLNYNFTCS